MILNDIPHTPVLTKEVLEAFSDIKQGTIIDCTLGYGGHSEALLKSNDNIKIIGIDQDESAVLFSKKRLEDFGDRATILHGRFSDMISKIKSIDIKGVLADIGVSSLQLDDKKRGFGFDCDLLDMRMDKRNPLSAEDVVNGYEKEKLEEIFKNYGEVREYRKIADLIVKERAKKPFASAKELSSFISKHLRSKKIHPATLIFQAIRIEVNDELGELKRLLKNIRDLNLSNATVAIISFHSLEDRIVKKSFKEWSKNCICPPNAFRCECENNHSFGEILTKRPITAGDDEIGRNPRARSAKLRLFKTKL